MEKIEKPTFDNKWDDLLLEAFSDSRWGRLASILDKCGEDNFHPGADNIFRCFKLTPSEKVKCVLLGQEPYHENNRKTDGLCFSIPYGDKLTPSLKNIFDELRRDPELKIDEGEKRDLAKWAKRGVLLLNAALTVEVDKENSHHEYWEWFTDYVIKTLSDRYESIAFILCGEKAAEKAWLIDKSKHKIIKVHHPAVPCSNIDTVKTGLTSLEESLNKVSGTLKSCQETLLNGTSSDIQKIIPLIGETIKSLSNKIDSDKVEGLNIRLYLTSIKTAMTKMQNNLRDLFDIVNSEQIDDDKVGDSLGLVKKNHAVLDNIVDGRVTYEPVDFVGSGCFSSVNKFLTEYKRWGKDGEIEWDLNKNP